MNGNTFAEEQYDVAASEWLPAMYITVSDDQQTLPLGVTHDAAQGLLCLGTNIKKVEQALPPVNPKML